MGKIKKLVWTYDGIESFEGVIRYIAEDSTYYASHFAKKILQAIERLKAFPLMGRIVPEYNNPDIRELIYRNYRIVYKIEKQTVYLALIIHGSKELPENV